MNGVGMLRQSYSVVLSHYRFFGLLEMWNDPQHASEWLTRARKLDAPEKTHAVLEKLVEGAIDARNAESGERDAPFALHAIRLGT